MARFYASISGKAATEGTREGTEKSGIYGHVRGWHSGVEITGKVGAQGEDIFLVYATGGSNGKDEKRFICKIVNGVITF